MNVFNAYVKGFIALAMLGFSNCLLALETETKKTQAVQSVVEPSNALGKVVLMLAIVIGVILLLAWLLNKSRSLNVLGQTGIIKTLAVMPLGIKEKIALVQVGNKQLILGITAQQINCLGVLDPPIASEELAQKTENNFAELLKRAIKK